MHTSHTKRWIFLLLTLALTLSIGTTALAKGPAEDLSEPPTKPTAAVSTTALLNSVMILLLMQTGYGIAGVRFVRSMNRMFDQICGKDGSDLALASTDQPTTPLS